MTKENCPMWLNIVWLIVGILYLLAAWVPTAFGWWGNNFPWFGVFAVLIALWGFTKK